MEHGSARIGQVFDFGMLHLEWPTALFVLIIFIITVFFLHSFLFKPILQTLDKRRLMVDKNVDDKKALNAEIAKNEQAYHTKLALVRESIQESRQQSLDDALAESKQILNETRSTIAVQLEKAEQELSSERDQALKDAAKLTGNLADLIKAKVLA